jgi:hypothetical protein
MQLERNDSRSDDARHEAANPAGFSEPAVGSGEPPPGDVPAAVAAQVEPLPQPVPPEIADSPPQ